MTTPNPPIPFAVLRNAHEGFRAGMKELRELITAQGNVSPFRNAWVGYQRALSAHAAMEDFEIFPLLDAVGNGSLVQEGIPEEHVTDHHNVARVDAALADETNADQWGAITEAFEVWSTYHLGHLEREERIMGPLTNKTAPTLEGRCRIVYDKVIVPSVLRSSTEFDFFVGWVVRQLSFRGSTANPAIVAVRVFVHGLKASSDATLWVHLLPIVKAHCSEDIYNEMKALYFIEDLSQMQQPSIADVPVAVLAR